jgi:hypothetical protein
MHGRLFPLAFALLAGCGKATYHPPSAPQPADPLTPAAEPLLLLAVDPPHGSTGVPEDVVIRAQFSRAPDPDTVTAATFRLIDESSGSEVPGRVGALPGRPGEPATWFSFVPREQLLGNSHPYRMELDPSIAAPDGALLDLEFSSVTLPSRFRTRGRPDTEAPRFFHYSARASAVSASAIRLSWFPALDVNEGGTHWRDLVYAIYQGLAADVVALDFPVAVTAPGAFEYTVGNLEPATAYYFIIRPRDAAGNEDDNRVVLSARTWVAADTTEVTVLYTADVFGTLEPCG